MSFSTTSINNPLALIAVLAATTEASALASLPLLDHRNQGVFIWFLVGFPPFLTLLFFITLNFNRSALAPEMAGSVPETNRPLAASLADMPMMYSTALAMREDAVEAAPPSPPLDSPAAAPVPRDSTSATTARLRILKYSSEGDWQQLQPLMHAWVTEALAQPHAGDAPAMILLLSE